MRRGGRFRGEASIAPLSQDRPSKGSRFQESYGIDATPRRRRLRDPLPAPGESYGLYAIPPKRHVPPPKHHNASPFDRAVQSALRFYDDGTDGSVGQRRRMVPRTTQRRVAIDLQGNHQSNDSDELNMQRKRRPPRQQPALGSLRGDGCDGIAALHCAGEEAPKRAPKAAFHGDRYNSSGIYYSFGRMETPGRPEERTVRHPRPRAAHFCGSSAAEAIGVGPITGPISVPSTGRDRAGVAGDAANTSSRRSRGARPASARGPFQPPMPGDGAAGALDFGHIRPWTTQNASQLAGGSAGERHEFRPSRRMVFHGNNNPYRPTQIY